MSVTVKSINKIKDMYWIFIILCLLLLFFNLEPLKIPFHNKFVLIWIVSHFYVVRIFPHDIYILIDENVCYLYQKVSSEDTYVSAVQLDTNYQHKVLNYKYLLEWMNQLPQVFTYPSHLINVIDILNFIRQKI